MPRRLAALVLGLRETAADYQGDRRPGESREAAERDPIVGVHGRNADVTDPQGQALDREGEDHPCGKRSWQVGEHEPHAEQESDAKQGTGGDVLFL